MSLADEHERIADATERITDRIKLGRYCTAADTSERQSEAEDEIVFLFYLHHLPAGD